MIEKAVPTCGKHLVVKEWKQTTFAYNEEGISIRVPDVYAWICPVDDEASFIPETADEFIATLRESFFY